MPPAAGASAALVVAALSLLGCGAGAPLLHPAHVLHPGDVTAGAGLSGELVVNTGSAADSRLTQLVAAPGIAPWVGGRFGIAGDNEAGLTYTGRAVRLDVRHAFPLGAAALSVGVGGSVINADRQGDGGLVGVFGGGVDIPVLFGVHSKSDLYAFWVGPRAGFEALGDGDASVRHFLGGFVVGVRGGFRHVHVALELDGAYHRADGTVSGSSLGVGLFSLAPSGALLFSF